MKTSQPPTTLAPHHSNRSTALGKAGRLTTLGLFAVIAVVTTGCPAPSDQPGSGTTDATAAEAESLIEPFDPPTLAELDAEVEWIDQPVVNPIERFRELQATWPPAEDVDTVLALRNDSDEANERILNTLGRLPASESEVNYDATLLRRIRGDVKSTNPIMQSSTQEFDVVGLCGVAFFGFDWTMTPFALADFVTSWQTSSDYRYDKIVLRDDLTWSDGKPLTAHDVVFSFQSIMNPKVPVPAVRSGTDKLRWIEAYDDHTLVYFQKAAEPTNVWNVNFPILPKHIYEDSLDGDPTLQESSYHVQLENKPVSGGPYQIVSRVRGQEIVMARREGWYIHNGKQVRDKPPFKEIRFRVLTDDNTALLALRNGDIEEMEITPEQWVTQTSDDEFYRKNTRARGAQWVFYYFGWNIATPLFEDVRVREAMSYAFDHDEMLNTINYGLNEPCAGVFHPTAWTASKNPASPYKQNLDKAEKLLDAAGWVDTDDDGIRDKEIGGRLVPFEFSMLVRNAPIRVTICELMRQNLDQIGVVCNVQPLEATVLQERTLTHKYQAAFGGWGTGTDPYTNENIFGTGKERNFGQYSNAEVDRLFDEGRAEFDREKRAAIYARIGELIYADQPYTFLYYQSAFYGFNKRVRGYMFSPRGPYHYNPGMDAIWVPAD